MKKIFVFLVLLVINPFLYSSEILIPFRINKKIGFLNENLNIIQKPVYTDINLMCKQAADVYIKKKGSLYLEHYVYTAKNGEIFISSTGDNNYLDISFIADKYMNITSFSDSNLYTINLTTMKSIDELSGLQLGNSISDEYIIVEYDGNNYSESESPSRTYFVDINGKKKLSQNDFTEIRCFDPLTKVLIVRKAARLWLVNEYGKYISEKNFSPTYQSIISDGLFLGISNDEKGFFNTEGDLIISINRMPELSIKFNSNVLPCIIENSYIDLYSEENYYSNKWTIIDTKGKIVKTDILANEIHEYSDDGTAVLRIKDGTKDKFSLIDTKGDIILKDFYDEIDDSINGYCMATKDGVDFLISSKDGTVYKCMDFNY